MRRILRMQRRFLDHFDAVRHTPIDWRIADLMNYLGVSRLEARATVASLVEKG
jgi:hypothetical protein